MAEVSKKCVQCGLDRPLSDFDRTYGRGSLAKPYSQGCKPCINAAKSLIRRLRRGSDSLSLQERFEQYFEPIPWSGCWIWTGSLTGMREKHRAGQFYDPEFKRQQVAYRVAWKIYRGPIPDGLSVCHTCDNRLCVNPDHLWLGTHQDNMRDMVRKGRNLVRRNVPAGDAHPGAKLNAALIKEIRQSKEDGASIARRLGVNRSTVNKARRGSTWEHH